VLYIWYYPARLKYVEVSDGSELGSGKVKTSEWRFSVFCAGVTFGHLFVLPHVPHKNH